jgi:hypothetical protein
VKPRPSAGSTPMTRKKSGVTRMPLSCSGASTPTPDSAAISALGLEHVWIVYPGERAYPLDENVTVVPLLEFPASLTS